MEKHTIKRDGLPPIAFTGELIGAGDNRVQDGNRANRWIEINIYRTQAGKFVASVERFTCWQGENGDRSAISRATADEIIDWLRGPDGSVLGAVSQEAVEKAAKVEPAFAAAWIETVE